MVGEWYCWLLWPRLFSLGEEFENVFSLRSLLEEVACLLGAHW